MVLKEKNDWVYLWQIRTFVEDTPLVNASNKKLQNTSNQFYEMNSSCKWDWTNGIVQVFTGIAKFRYGLKFLFLNKIQNVSLLTVNFQADFLLFI